MLNRIPFVNRIFGREPWAAGLGPWNRRLYRRVRSNPPSCLAGVDVEPAHSDKNAEQARWALICNCGERQGRVLGYPLKQRNAPYDGNVLFVSPLAYLCGACSETTEFFDTARHGHDAECSKRFGGMGDHSIRGEGDREASACPTCDSKSHLVFASFSFAHFDIIDDEPELETVAQDFFDSFACFGQCGACGNEWLVASFELA